MINLTEWGKIRPFFTQFCQHDIAVVRGLMAIRRYRAGISDLGTATEIRNKDTSVAIMSGQAQMNFRKPIKESHDFDPLGRRD